MPFRSLFAPLALLAVAAHAQHAPTRIDNYARAEAYTPALVEDSETFSASYWDFAGHRSEVEAKSFGHPWEPTDNHATAWSLYTQSNDLESAVIRSKSEAVGTYSIFSTAGYFAQTILQADYELKIDTFHSGSTDLFLLVPMHGLLGVTDGFMFESHALARSTVRIDGQTKYDGMVETESFPDHDFLPRWSATGNWAGYVQRKKVPFFWNGYVAEMDGVELSTFGIINMGQYSAAHSSYHIEYYLETLASIKNQEGNAAIADFSGTGGLEIIGLDEQGNRVDLDVFYADPVPEPATLAVFGIGIVATRFRRCFPSKPRQ